VVEIDVARAVYKMMLFLLAGWCSILAQAADERKKTLEEMVSFFNLEGFEFWI
jgi:predicted ATPase